MTQAVERMRDRLGWLENPVVDRIFKAIALVSLLGMLFVGGKQYALTNCLASYNEASNANSKLRAAAAAEEREALDAMISAIAEAQTVPAASRQNAVRLALQDYQLTRRYIDGKREVMPIPEPPSQTCG